MVVVLFRSRLTAAAVAAGYSEMADEMEARARTMPGFVDFKSFKADDGERLSIAWWQDEETLTAWREDVRHRVAQRLGREMFYEYPLDDGKRQCPEAHCPRGTMATTPDN